MVMLVNIHTTGKHSGRRVVQDVKKKLKEKIKGKCVWQYRVTLMNGSTVTVEDLTILDTIEKKS